MVVVSTLITGEGPSSKGYLRREMRRQRADLEVDSGKGRGIPGSSARCPALM